MFCLNAGYETYFRMIAITIYSFQQKWNLTNGLVDKSRYNGIIEPKDENEFPEEFSAACWMIRKADPGATDRFQER